MENHNNSPNKRQVQDRALVLNFIRTKVERLFYIALKHITTTKKALCTAIQIPVEVGCRYKRTLEKEGLLVQSVDEVICPYTKHTARLISTNPKEFERLTKSKSNQITLF